MGVECGLSTVLALPFAIDYAAGEGGVDGTAGYQASLLFAAGAVALLAFGLGCLFGPRMGVAWRRVDLVAGALFALAVTSAAFAPDVGAVRFSGCVLLAAAVAGLMVRTASFDAGGPGRSGGRDLLLLGGVLFVLVDLVGALAAGPLGLSFHLPAPIPSVALRALLYATTAVLAITRALERGRGAAARVVGAVAAVLSGYALVRAAGPLPLLLPALGVAVASVLALLFLLFRRALARSPAAAVVFLVVLAGLAVKLALMPMDPQTSAWMKDRFNAFVAAADVDYDAAYAWPSAWKSSFRSFEAAPVLGHGLGNLRRVLPIYNGNERLDSDGRGQVVQVLAELGLPGLALFFLLLALGLFGALWGLSSRGGFSILCAYMTWSVGLVFVSVSDSATGALWFAALFGVATTGVAGGAARRRTKRATSEHAASDHEPERSRSAVDRADAAVVGEAREPAGGEPVLLHRPWLRFLIVPAASVIAAGFLIQESRARLIGTERLRAAGFAARSGDGEGVVRALQSAVDVGVDDAGTYLQLGTALLEVGRLDEAVAAFRAAAERYPGYALIPKQQGQALFKLGRFGAAATCFETASGLKPGDQDLARWHAQALLSAGQLDRSIHLMQEAGGPEDPALTALLGDALFSRARRDGSLDDAKGARLAYQQLSRAGGGMSDRVAKIALLDAWIGAGLVPQ